MAYADPPPGLCGHVRPDRGRPGPPRRYRAVHRGRAGLHRLWRRGEVRRRQGHPRRHGPVPGDAGRGRRRHGGDERADPRPLGRRKGGYRHPGRAHPGGRQGGQSRHPGRGGHRHRPGHGNRRRQGQDRHRRRLRLPHPFHLPAADRGGARIGHHDHAGRRHRHQCHHLHAGPLAPATHDRGCRRLRHESRLRRQGQCEPPGRAGGAGAGGRLRAQAPTRTGARRRPPSTPASALPTRWTSR